MVLGRSQSTDSIHDPDPMAASGAVAAADLAAAVVTGSNQQLHTAGIVSELSADSHGSEERHMPHPWMRPEVAATIRTIHNNKKATIRQHYYPEGKKIKLIGRQIWKIWKFDFNLVVKKVDGVGSL